jgi:transcriptional regulator with XRE-family HTH domain
MRKRQPAPDCRNGATRDPGASGTPYQWATNVWRSGTDDDGAAERWLHPVTSQVSERRRCRGAMSVQNPRAFNEWLRAQLKAKKMSQRQLAQQSGVDHSTISRLLRGDRTPSLGTATKLAKGLRELRDDTDSPQYFGLTSSSSTHPTARVEYALRSDELMSEPQVRQVMEYYLALRMRRLSVRQTGRYAPARPVAAVRSVPRTDEPNKKH